MGDGVITLFIVCRYVAGVAAAVLRHGACHVSANSATTGAADTGRGAEQGDAIVTGQ